MDIHAKFRHEKTQDRGLSGFSPSSNPPTSKMCSVAEATNILAVICSSMPINHGHFYFYC